MMKVYCIIFLLIILTEDVVSQTIKPLTVGNKIEGQLWKKIPKKKNTQVVILDFWTTTCYSCIVAFPKMEKLQRDFGDKLQVVMVNNWENDKTIRQRFEGLNKENRKGNPLTIPTALPAINGPGKLGNLFPSLSVPQHVWLNKEGVVMAITDGRTTTSTFIREAIDNGKIDLPVKDDFLSSDLTENGLVQSRYSLIKPVYYSALMNYDPGAGYSPLTKTINERDSTFRISFRGYDIIKAFTESFQRPDWQTRIIVELKKKEMVERPLSIDSQIVWEKKYWISYEMQGSLKDEKIWQQTMRDELIHFLRNRFSVEARMERRKLNSLVLIKVKDGLLNTRGGDREYIIEDNYHSWKNHPFWDITGSDAFLHQLEDMGKKRPFVDQTGFIGNIDMELRGDLKDINNLRPQLKQYGLDIVEMEIEFEILVIGDKDYHIY